jgi:hypothetical protein
VHSEQAKRSSKWEESGRSKCRVEEAARGALLPPMLKASPSPIAEEGEEAEAEEEEEEEEEETLPAVR